MFPEFPRFKQIDISDRAAMESFLAKNPKYACEFSFANLYIWQDFDRPAFTIVDGNLCILINPLDEPRFFLEPIGNGTAAVAAEKCLRHTGRISRASTDFVSSFRADALHVEHMRDHFDYVYRVEDLAMLKGRRYDAKRNHIKAFERANPRYEFVELTAAHHDDAMRIFDEWCDHKIKILGAEPGLEFDCQRWALGRAFEGFADLGMIGCGLAVEGSLAGFVLATRLTPEIACVHLEYHSPRMHGVAQTLFREACRNTLSRFEYVNLEQDLGIAGLRRHKESYHPSRMEEKFDVLLKGGAS